MEGMGFPDNSNEDEEKKSSSSKSDTNKYDENSQEQ